MGGDEVIAPQNGCPGACKQGIQLVADTYQGDLKRRHHCPIATSECLLRHSSEAEKSDGEMWRFPDTAGRRVMDMGKPRETWVRAAKAAAEALVSRFPRNMSGPLLGWRTPLWGTGGRHGTGSLASEQQQPEARPDGCHQRQQRRRRQRCLLVTGNGFFTRTNRKAFLKLVCPPIPRTRGCAAHRVSLGKWSGEGGPRWRTCGRQ